MSKEFNVEHQFELYLQRVDLASKVLTAVQYQEMKRAFYGAWGQQLLLMNRSKISSDVKRSVISKMVSEVSKFWQSETDRLKKDVNIMPLEIQPIEIKITIQEKENGKLKILTDMPLTANAGVVCQQLVSLGQGILDRIQDKLGALSFDKEEDVQAYLKTLTMEKLSE